MPRLRGINQRSEYYFAFQFKKKNISQERDFTPSHFIPFFINIGLVSLWTTISASPSRLNYPVIVSKQAFVLEFLGNLVDRLATRSTCTHLPGLSQWRGLCISMGLMELLLGRGFATAPSFQLIPLTCRSKIAAQIPIAVPEKNDSCLSYVVTFQLPAATSQFCV